MKLIAFEAGGGVQMGVVSPDDRVSTLTDVESFYRDVAGWLGRAEAAAPGALRLADLRLVPALPERARIFCVGLNYRAHADEGGNEVAPYPTLFGRWMGSMSADGAPVPALEAKLDWEGELAVVIGASAFRIGEDEAMARVFAYAPFNDISARAYQRHSTQWTLGKNGDGSGPMGALITADEVGDPVKGLRLTTRVNGELMQDATTADMIYGVARVISYISEIVTLAPGDMIATGTPEGVGYARKPPRFLAPGDIVEVEIEKVGRIRNPIVAA